MICHGHPSLVEKFTAFFNNYMRTQEKIFIKERDQIFNEIKKVFKLLNPNNYIIYNLVFLVTKLITFDSEKRIDLMAAYKFIKLIEMKQLDFHIG